MNPDIDNMAAIYETVEGTDSEEWFKGYITAAFDSFDAISQQDDWADAEQIKANSKACAERLKALFPWVVK